MPLYVVIAALAVATAILAGTTTLLSGRALNHRVSRNLIKGQTLSLREMMLERPAMERTFRPLLGAVSRRARRITPRGVVEALDRRLELAASPWSLEKLLVAKLGGSVAGGALGLIWYAANPTRASLLMVVGGLAIGYTLPDAVLGRRVRERQDAILKELPDSLDQLTICVEAGLGFDAALHRTARSVHGPLGEELRRALQDVQLGLDRAEALRRLADRTDVEELRHFVHAVTQAESYGVPVSQVLRIQAGEQREKRRARAEERAMKIPVKLVFPLVFCILPGLFVVVIGPGLIRMMNNL